MGQTQLSVEFRKSNDTVSQVAQTRGQRGIPADWFVDPADPGAAQSHEAANRQALEDQATAFLHEHDYVAQPSDVPESASTAVPVWIGIRPGLDDFSDEGELGWQTDALCAQTDPEAFFPEKGGSTRDAKKVCGSCNVKSQCLEYALANDERFGIWGGLSERERRRLRKRAV